MRQLATLLLLAAAVSVFLRPLWAAPVAAMLAVVAALILDPPVLRTVARLAVVLAVTFAAALSGTLVAFSGGAGRGIEVAIALLLRLLVLVILAALMARLVDIETVIRVTRRLRLDRLGLVLGLALNAWPHLAVATRDVWCATVIRSRQRGRLGLIRALPQLVEVMLAHTARIAEEAAAAAALRGHSALVTMRQPLEILPPRVVVVTGGRGSGKTAALEALVAARDRLMVSLSGFLQPGVWEEDRKVGFEILDVVSGESASFARRVSGQQGEHGTGFRFSAEGLALARSALARSAAGDVLLVDELGPLELRGLGHMDAVRRALAVPGLLAAVVVVRRSLVPALLAALEAENAVVVDVETSDDAVAEILEILALAAPRAEVSG